MTEATRLLELAERVEKAKEPDRELDALIFIAVHWPSHRLQTTCDKFPDEVRVGRIQEGDSFGWREAPAYTAALDAAKSLWPGEVPHLIPSSARICTAMALRELHYFRARAAQGDL